MRRFLMISLLPLACLCACREKARTAQDTAAPREENSATPDTPAPQPQTMQKPAPKAPTRPEDLTLPEDPATALPMPGAADAILVKPTVIPQGVILPEERAVSSDIPGPERAKAAAARVRPELERSLAVKGLHFGDPVFIRAFKEEGQVEAWMRRRDTGKYEHFRTWDVAAQSGKPGPKMAEGDGQVPEGFYFVPPAAMKPDSTFHLAFNIGYPNAYDQHHGRTGSFIMIHGNCVSIGCLAMTDPKIEEIYTLCDAALKKGQPYFRVNLFPFRMTSERLAREEGSEWFDFWTNLKEGYDHFESTHVPPQAEVTGGRYEFK
ncbi:hypothetical protein OKA04_14130 [Luteolibacter flavescens]|uniref:L,D-TPase catalytic domain-containing protein n=1 Tax=Luteolibacter flavescens TaxID=1859460 RepID=A0ABT3FQM3_9BACT|nr:L,D-transpeptidase family protein [Luteolibacter flavescens]MCW1885873.1 hypothetical protein [Luteolibacter flavescens]